MKWEFNKVQLEIDAGDPDYLDKYEDAIDTIGNKESELSALAERCNQGLERKSKFVREYVQMFWDFFDQIHGKDTAKKIFSGKKSVELCNQAYASYIGALKSQSAQIEKQRQLLFEHKI